MAQIQNDNSNSKILLTEDCTVENIQSIKSVFQSAFSSNNIEVNFDEVETFDLSFLQLLISSKKKAEAEEKIISIKSLNNENFQNLIDCTGLQNQFIEGIDG